MTIPTKFGSLLAQLFQRRRLKYKKFMDEDTDENDRRL